jgi:hypothetical protein
MTPELAAVSVKEHRKGSDFKRRGILRTDVSVLRRYNFRMYSATLGINLLSSVVRGRGIRTTVPAS